MCFERLLNRKDGSTVLKKLIALVLMGILVATVSVTTTGCSKDKAASSK